MADKYARIFYIKEPPGKHPMVESGVTSAGLPAAGLSLWATRRLRKILSTLTNPDLTMLTSLNREFHPQLNSDIIVFAMLSEDPYTADELVDDGVP